MTRRQTMPERWLIIDSWRGRGTERAIRRLPRGSGVLILCPLRSPERRWLRHLARLRQLVVVEDERRTTARIHDMHELRVALQRRAALVFISPIHPTKTHPAWRPVPRMRAAAYARLAGRKALALGGMNGRRFSRVAQLGFVGWAGISAFRT